MAEDIRLTWDRNLMECDFAIKNDDISMDDGLETAVYISIYTDRQASDDDPYDNNDRRGWWADQTQKEDGDKIGSRLWLLDRSKTTTENLRMAKIYLEEALQWLVDDGVAAKVEVVVERGGQSPYQQLSFKIIIQKSDGNTVAYKFDDLWESQMMR